MKQLDIVKEKLQNEGYIDNLWAIQHGIWRLSAIIYTLRHEENLEIETKYKNQVGMKNTFYILKQKDEIQN